MSDDLGHEHIENQPVQPAGARGGSAAFAAAHPGEDYFTAWAKTIVRWGPIWVGLVVALGINLVLYALTMAISLSVTSPGTTAGTDVLKNVGIGTALASLVALFIGGFLAGRLGIQQGLRNGVMQGSVVWALFVIAMMLFSVFGLGGTVSNLAGMANTKGLVGGTGMSAADAARMMTSAANSMWWLFGGLVVSWIFAAIGGSIGALSARPDEEVH